MFKDSMLIKIDDFEDFSTMNEVRKKDRELQRVGSNLLRR